VRSVHRPSWKVSEAELAPPFDDLITITYFGEVVRDSQRAKTAARRATVAATTPGNDKTSTAFSGRGGSNVQSMVELYNSARTYFITKS